MCINTDLRIVNGRFGSDANIGNFTCITDRSASTIDYILADEVYSQYITDVQVSDRLESIQMSLILDFQHNNERNMHSQSFINIPKKTTTKYVWNIERHQFYIDNLRLNLGQISDEFQRAVLNSNYVLPLKLIVNAIYNAAESMNQPTILLKTSYQQKSMINLCTRGVWKVRSTVVFLSNR